MNLHENICLNFLTYVKGQTLRIAKLVKFNGM